MSCRSPSFLNEVINRLHGGTNSKARKASITVLKMILSSYKKPFPIFRTLQGVQQILKAPRIAYKDLGEVTLADGFPLRKAVTAANCHDGAEQTCFGFA